jgi:hypothetical protein
MSLIIEPGHVETAEAEFAGHPDVFSSIVAARSVYDLAIGAGKEGVGDFRADLTVQAHSIPPRKEKPGVKMKFAGHLNIPEDMTHSLNGFIREVVLGTLREFGYDFNQRDLEISTKALSNQGAILNSLSRQNVFVDSCGCYGHYVAPPFGIDGTFPSLAIARKIDGELGSMRDKIPELRPDGKVHVTAKYLEDGFSIERVYLSVAHKRELPTLRIEEKLVEKIPELEGAEILINAGGEFNQYFLPIDSGVSKAKDGVMITGGIHQIGTDGVWGKCLQKASSVALPYSFALARAVCEATGTTYSSVGVFPEHGQREAAIRLQEISPDREYLRPEIDARLAAVPRDKEGIRELLGMPVTIDTYRTFNDPLNFHAPDKPWKARNEKLIGALRG